MECEICHKTPADGITTLHRVNEKGVKGIWRCKRHLTHDQEAAIDPEVLKITQIIEKRNMQVAP